MRGQLREHPYLGHMRRISDGDTTEQYKQRSTRLRLRLPFCLSLEVLNKHLQNQHDGEHPRNNAVLDLSTSKSARSCACSREPCGVEVAGIERSAVLRVERLDRGQHVGTLSERAAARTDGDVLAT